MQEKEVAITAYDIYHTIMEYEDLTDKQKDELLYLLSLKTKAYDVAQE